MNATIITLLLTIPQMGDNTPTIPLPDNSIWCDQPSYICVPRKDPNGPE